MQKAPRGQTMHVLLLDGFGNPTGEDGVQLMLYAMPRSRSVAVTSRVPAQ